MSDWEKKKIEIAKAKEFISLAYERDVRLQKKVQKGVAEKKLLLHLKDIWFDKNLSILGDDVPKIQSIKRWYDEYAKSRKCDDLIPHYGKSLGNSVIPKDHTKIIYATLSGSKIGESTRAIVKKIKTALNTEGLSQEYSDATLLRFIKKCRVDFMYSGQSLDVNERLRCIESRLNSLKISPIDSYVIKIPLFMHAVCAGDPCTVSSEIEEYIPIPKKLTRHPDSTWAVRANGDSMIGAGIETGDILIVDHKVSVKDRCIVIASINGEQTVKRILIKAGTVTLSPENPQYQAIKLNKIDDVKILGTVLGIYRSLY